MFEPSVRPVLSTECLSSLKIGCIFFAGLGALVLLFFLAYIHSCVRARPSEGFFDRNSGELDYYKRVYSTGG